MDEFEIESEVGEGTTIMMRKWAPERSEQAHAIVDWAVATLALEGESESGDLHVVSRSRAGRWWRRSTAWATARRPPWPHAAAADALERQPGQPVMGCSSRCHEACAAPAAR